MHQPRTCCWCLLCPFVSHTASPWAGKRHSKENASGPKHFSSKNASHETTFSGASLLCLTPVLWSARSGIQPKSKLMEPKRIDYFEILEPASERKQEQRGAWTISPNSSKGCVFLKPIVSVHFQPCFPVPFFAWVQSSHWPASQQPSINELCFFSFCSLSFPPTWFTTWPHKEL